MLFIRSHSTQKSKLFSILLKNSLSPTLSPSAAVQVQLSSFRLFTRCPRHFLCEMLLLQISIFDFVKQFSTHPVPVYSYTVKGTVRNSPPQMSLFGPALCQFFCVAKSSAATHSPRYMPRHQIFQSLIFRLIFAQMSQRESNHISAGSFHEDKVRNEGKCYWFSLSNLARMYFHSFFPMQ